MRRRATTRAVGTPDQVAAVIDRDFADHGQITGSWDADRRNLTLTATNDLPATRTVAASFA